MKGILTLSLMALVSCGKIEVLNDETLGNLKSINPFTYGPASTEHSRLTSICNSIDLKTQSIAALTNSQWSFTQTSKGCSENSFTNKADATVTLVNSLSGFKFMEGANFFSFADPELTNAGVLAEVCAALRSPEGLKSPIVVGTQNYIYFSIDSRSTDCADSPDGNELCVKVERAVQTTTNDGPKAKVHSRDWIRVRVNEPRRGFWTHRKVLTEAGCDEDQTTGRTATLK